MKQVTSYFARVGIYIVCTVFTYVVPFSIRMACESER
jgi:hypothetical protein